MNDAPRTNGERIHRAYFNEKRAREMAQRDADTADRLANPENWVGLETDPGLIAIFGQTYRRKVEGE